MKRLVSRSMAGRSSATVIEWALIIGLIDLACLTSWLYLSASLNTPPASANMTVSVEATGSVRTRGLHRAPRTREPAPLLQTPSRSPGQPAHMGQDALARFRGSSMKYWTAVVIALLVTTVSSCSSIKGLIHEPTAFGEFEVSRDYEDVFRRLKSYALRCYQEKDYDHKTTIEARLSNEFKSAEISVVTRWIDITKYKMYIGLKAIGPRETAVTVNDLYVDGADHRLGSLKTAAKAGSASC
jgi:Flp pilus assembly pilin Flp